MNYGQAILAVSDSVYDLKWPKLSVLLAENAKVVKKNLFNNSLTLVLSFMNCLVIFMMLLVFPTNVAMLRGKKIVKKTTNVSSINNTALQKLQNLLHFL